MCIRDRAQAEQAAAEDKEHPGAPEDKAQRNFTDPESRIMPGPGGREFLQAYNCQAVVDHENQVIVAARATNRLRRPEDAFPGSCRSGTGCAANYRPNGVANATLAHGDRRAGLRSDQAG